MKKCTKCGVLQPLENYYKATGGRDGLRGDCKDCFRTRAKERYPKVREQSIERAKRWRDEHREQYLANQRRMKQSPEGRLRERAGYLRRTYRITPERYDELLAAQAGVCAVCGRRPTPGISLHVDHHHGSGRIRGLLCFRCNNALGDFEDSPELLSRAAEYVFADRLTARLTDLVAMSAGAASN